MLVIKIELWPGGDKTKMRDLGTMFIVNSGQGTRNFGSYEVMLSKWGKPEEPYKVGAVTGFDRLKGSPWELMRRCIVAATTQRNGDHQLRQRMVNVARRALRGQTTFMLEEPDGGEQEGQYGTADPEDGEAATTAG